MQFTYRNPDRSTDPGRILEGARTLVVGLRRHRTHRSSPPAGRHGLVARYAADQAYDDLAEGLGAIAAVVERAGYRARVVADSNALVDRNAAWRAGLGWWAKNTSLLSARFGSFVVIGTVVTDAEVIEAGVPVADAPAVDDGCGPCTACLDGCPTGALVAPGVLDARRCISWLVQSADPIPVELRAAIGDRLYGCDLCQDVCPVNRGVAGLSAGTETGDDPAGAGAVTPPAGDDRDWVDLDRLLAATDDELLECYGHWYLANRDPDVVRRTALVILGNTAEGADPPVAATLERYLGDPNPLLRSHAAWACRRLDLEDLARLVAGDPDPMVRAELDHTVEVRS
jgi:epoxyqueuosine reductase